jgi:hypothetical protein
VPVYAQRELAHVEPAGPVLAAAPVLDPRGVNDRAQFSY